MRNLRQLMPPMSIVVSDIDISSSVLVRPWLKSRPQQKSTRVLAAIVPPQVTSCLSFSCVRLNIHATPNAAESFRNSAGSTIVEPIIRPRRAPLTLTPTISTSIISTTLPSTITGMKR